MKKNILVKGILVLTIIALLAIGFTGCTLIFSSTGTVYITVEGDWRYNLYMDSQEIYLNVEAGTYVLYDVPVGDHFFEAIDTVGSWLGYYSVTQYIHSEVNNVYLYPQSPI